MPFVVAGVSLAIVTSAPPALAQGRVPTAGELETARTLYKEGKELRAAGDLPGAIEKLRAAHALGNTPVTGVELARTYVLAGKLVEAREIALSVARMTVAGDETEKSAEARADAAKLAEELRPRIPTLTVRVHGLGDTEVAHLTVDGVVIPDAAINEPLSVNPGKHDVQVRVDWSPNIRGQANPETPEGRAMEITVEAPPPAEVKQPHRGTPLIAGIAFGTAIAAGIWYPIAYGVAGVYTSNLSTECNPTFSAAPRANTCVNGTAGGGDYNQAHLWATVTDATLVIGGLALITGVVDMLVERSPSVPPSGSGSSGVRIAPMLGSVAGVHGQF
jgi:hypothetical protein